MTFAGEKKCRPITSSGRAVARGDLVDVERRGVRRQHARRLRDAIELRKHLLLEIHALEHRLDDDVGVGEIAVVERAADQRQALRLVRRRTAGRA